MDFSLPPELGEIRTAVRALCERFPGEYWRALEPDRYPDEFVDALTKDGWLAALIPEEYGGAGLGLTAASVILEEINASGGNDWFFAPMASALPLVKDGKLLALAVSSAQRSPALPNVPTTVEAGVPDSDYTLWVGMIVPSGISLVMPPSTPGTISLRMRILAKVPRTITLWLPRRAP